MSQPELLNVKNLKTWIDTEGGTIRAVDDISFSIKPGETVAILGESGCGKSVTALSIMQLIPKPAGRIVSGSVKLAGENLLKKSELEMRQFRGKRIAMIFQEPQTSLNPVMTIGQQIAESIPDKQQPADFTRKEIIKLLESVGMADAERRYNEYPHQLSGGMKQRAMIAMALASKPDILIADEPTTALDVTIQAQILDLLVKLQQENNMAILLITHDLGVVSQMADRVLLMYAGEIIENSSAENFFSQPRHPYAKKLFQSLPGRDKRQQKLTVIPGMVPTFTESIAGCRFADRCDRAWDLCFQKQPEWLVLAGDGVKCHLYNELLEKPAITATADLSQSPAGPEPVSSKTSGSEILLEVNNLKVHFPIHRGVLRRVVGYVKAVDGISLNINRGKTLAIVGESGCGKTTAGKAILQLIKPSAGSVIYDGQELTTTRREALRLLRKKFQIIFQDPYASLNPRMMVGEIIAEGLYALGIDSSGASAHEKVNALLTQVGLPVDAHGRYPHEFSGGQRQRISIARALAVSPGLIVCDEPTSALDVSVQAQILNLLNDLQDELALSYLFITHDISVVEYLAHEVAVMYLGRIVEHGTVSQVLDNPRHPYTQALLSAVPVISQTKEKIVVQTKLAGDIPSPSKPPAGCYFHTRCPRASSVCSQKYPRVTHLDETHSVYCHLYEADDERS